MEFTILPVTPYQQNCSLVWDDAGRAALIDPGGEAERLLAEVARRGLTLERLLLTHGHLDHVGAAVEIRDALGIPIIGPQREEQYWLVILPRQAELFGFPPIAPFTPDAWLEDGDTVDVGALRFDVLHCPGHTPGHVVFYQREARLAFVGDVLFKGSIGRTDFPRGDHQTLIRSIREKLFPLGDEVRFVPGHGPESTFGTERRGAPVFTSLKISREKIYDLSPITTPDMVVVLDATLLQEVDVVAGLKENGLVVLNAPPPVANYNFGNARVAVADVTAHGLEAGLKAGIVNSGIIGAFAKASGLVDIDTLARAIEEEFAGKKPELNARAARIAYEHTFIGE